MAEPRVVRIERLSRQTVGIFPRCERCDTPLSRKQMYWCSPNCRANSSRLRRLWERRLAAYWETVA